MEKKRRLAKHFKNDHFKNNGQWLNFPAAAASRVETDAKSFVSSRRSRLWPRCFLTRGRDQDIEENVGSGGGDSGGVAW